MLLAHQLTWSVASHDEESEVAHGYLGYGAIFIALAAAVVAVATTHHFVKALGGGDLAEAPPAGMFAVMPIVGFVFQEHLEHLVAARELEVGFFVSPPFVVGLALQLPFAFAAMLVARLILRVIETAASALRELAPAPRFPVRHISVSAIPVTVDRPPRCRGLAFSCAGRAPPAVP
jgi:hypothetical protein